MKSLLKILSRCGKFFRKPQRYKKRFDSHRRDRCRVTSCHESAGCYPQQQQQQQKQTNNQVYAVLATRDTAKAKPNSFV